MKQTHSFVALHGFLGQPSDWNPLDFDNLTGIDLFNFSTLSLYDSAAQLNQQFGVQNKPQVLMGYSLGGRLALHMLLEDPSLWSAAIIISAHPGLKTTGERQKRLEEDQKWALRFQTENWADLIQDWNRRPVFSKGLPVFQRSESDFNRAILANTLCQWSLGLQEDLSGKIAKLTIPILWITGENDLSYTSLANLLTFSNPLSRIWAAPKAGHRIPWEEMAAFKVQVNQFLIGKGYDSIIENRCVE